MKRRMPLTEKELLKKIKEKKEFQGLADKIVEKALKEYIKKYNLSIKNISSPQAKIIVKEIRSHLRNLVGRFQKSIKDRNKFLESGQIDKLLKTHISTAERIKTYPFLKKLIKKISPDSILDLGCGLNPIALATLKIKYYASDIKEDELEIIERFFKKRNIKGKTFVYDLTNVKNDLPKVELCLLFKVLDIIDDKNHKISEDILLKVPCKKILISFATKKLSGRAMNFPERIWFEKLLKKHNLEFKKYERENEIFYLIEKSTTTHKQSRTARNQERSYHQNKRMLNAPLYRTFC